MPTELQLGELFWKKISTDPRFQAWFLGRTNLRTKRRFSPQTNSGISAGMKTQKRCRIRD